MTCDPLKDIRASGKELWANLADTSSQSPLDRCSPGLVRALQEEARLDDIAAARQCAPSESGEASRADLTRIAAAYCLWPYYAAIYYANSATAPSLALQERQEARTKLCAIQRILFADLQATLDSMRCMLRVRACEDLSKPLLNEKARSSRWGETLVAHIPDLCLIDSLVTEVLDLVLAVPLVHQALSEIQGISLGASGLTEPQCVRNAFTQLRLAQLTIFYHPNPSLIPPDQELLLGEFVHETSQELQGFPARLVPFLVVNEDGSWSEDPDGNAFRALAHQIYSAPSQDFPWFKQQRQATLRRIGNPEEHTRFVSSGETTHQFLTEKPPTNNWPIWYALTLRSLADARIEDWSNPGWWETGIGSVDVIQRLFPGPSELHQNCHASAYFDYLAGEGKSLPASWHDLPDRFPTESPTGAGERFGHLMELLLRRTEELTRTSVLFRLAQTHEEDSPQLCQFVGGTFLGLERPGIPFELGRFEAIADHLRPLVVGLVHFCTTRLVERVQKLRSLDRQRFRGAIETVVNLLAGKEAPYQRNGRLLFSADHRPVDEENGLSRKHIAQTFQPNWERNKFGVVAEECDRSWKALLEIGDTDSLDAFVNEPSDDPMTSKDPVKCAKCLEDAFRYLIGQRWDGAGGIREKSTIEVGQGIRLPSRPGIRFVMSLCRFLVDLETDTREDSSRLSRLSIRPGEVEIVFTNCRIVNKVREWLWCGARARSGNHSESIFYHLVRCNPLEADMQVDTEWAKFLQAEEFGGGYRIGTHNQKPKLWLRWSPL
jgi:hypothetical protein